MDNRRKQASTYRLRNKTLYITWHRAKKIKKTTLKKKKKIGTILTSFFFHVFSLIRYWKVRLSNCVDCPYCKFPIFSGTRDAVFHDYQLPCFNIFWHNLFLFSIQKSYVDSMWISNIRFFYTSFNVLYLQAL